MEVDAYANRFLEGHWSFLGPGTKEQVDGTHTYNPNGLWNQSAEKRTLILRGTGALARGSFLEKTGKEESHRFTATVTCKPQRCCFAQSFPSATSVSTERSRIGVKNWLSTSQNIRFPARWKPWRIWMNSWIVHLRDHNERFRKLPGDIKVNQTGENSRIYEESFSWTTLQNCLRSWWWIWRKHWSMPRVFTTRHNDCSEPVEWIRGHTKIGPVIQFKSRSRVILHHLESKFKWNPWRMTDPSRGLWCPEERTNTWKKSTKRKENLPITKRWPVVPASGNRSRHNNKDNRVHQRIFPPRCSDRLTNGNGMVFLPRMTSWKGP